MDFSDGWGSVCWYQDTHKLLWFSLHSPIACGILSLFGLWLQLFVRNIMLFSEWESLVMWCETKEQYDNELLSCLMTKPNKWPLRPAKIQISLSIRQSDQSLRCPNEETVGSQQPIERTTKTLIRLGGCPGWSVFAGRTDHFVGLAMRRLI